MLGKAAKLGRSSIGSSWFPCWQYRLANRLGLQVSFPVVLFFGSFGLMVIGLFGNAVDLVLNPFSRAGSGQTQIVCSMFSDVGLRMGEAFGCSTDPIPITAAAARKKAA